MAHQLGAVYGSVEVGRNDFIPHIQGEVFQPVAAVDAGGIDENINPSAQLFCGLRHGGVQGGAVRHVALNGIDRRAVALHLLGHLLGIGAVVEDHDFCTCVMEPAGQAVSDSLASSGDERFFAGQIK